MYALMKECQGAMILAFSQSFALDNSGKIIGFSPTEYNHFEGALAIAQEIPLLIIAEQEVVRRVIVWQGGGAESHTYPQMLMLTGSTPIASDKHSIIGEKQ